MKRLLARFLFAMTCGVLVTSPSLSLSGAGTELQKPQVGFLDRIRNLWVRPRLLPKDTPPDGPCSDGRNGYKFRIKGVCGPGAAFVKDETQADGRLRFKLVNDRTMYEFQYGILGSPLGIGLGMLMPSANFEPRGFFGLQYYDDADKGYRDLCGLGAPEVRMSQETGREVAVELTWKAGVRDGTDCDAQDVIEQFSLTLALRAGDDKLFGQLKIKYYPGVGNPPYALRFYRRANSNGVPDHKIAAGSSSDKSSVDRIEDLASGLVFAQESSQCADASGQPDSGCRDWLLFYDQDNNRPELHDLEQPNSHGPSGLLFLPEETQAFKVDTRYLQPELVSDGRPIHFLLWEFLGQEKESMIHYLSEHGADFRRDLLAKANEASWLETRGKNDWARPPQYPVMAPLCAAPDESCAAVFFTRPLFSLVNDTYVPQQENVNGDVALTNLRVTAAPGEAESATFYLHARDKDLPNVTASIGKPGPTSAPTLDLHVLRVMYANNGNRTYSTYERRFAKPEEGPEPLPSDLARLIRRPTMLVKDDRSDTELLPGDRRRDYRLDFSGKDANGKPLDHIALPHLDHVATSVKRGHTKQFWLTVTVPEDAQPGVYETDLSVAVNGQELRNIPVTIRVPPVRLAGLSEIFGLFYPAQIRDASVLETPSQDGWRRVIPEEQMLAELLDMKRHGFDSPSIGYSLCADQFHEPGSRWVSGSGAPCGSFYYENSDKRILDLWNSMELSPETLFAMQGLCEGEWVRVDKDGDGKWDKDVRGNEIWTCTRTLQNISWFGSDEPKCMRLEQELKNGTAQGSILKEVGLRRGCGPESRAALKSYLEGIAWGGYPEDCTRLFSVVEQACEAHATGTKLWNSVNNPAAAMLLNWKCDDLSACGDNDSCSPDHPECCPSCVDYQVTSVGTADLMILNNKIIDEKGEARNFLDWIHDKGLKMLLYDSSSGEHVKPHHNRYINGFWLARLPKDQNGQGVDGMFHWVYMGDVEPSCNIFDTWDLSSRYCGHHMMAYPARLPNGAYTTIDTLQFEAMREGYDDLRWLRTLEAMDPRALDTGRPVGDLLARIDPKAMFLEPAHDRKTPSELTRFREIIIREITGSQDLVTGP